MLGAAGGALNAAAATGTSLSFMVGRCAGSTCTSTCTAWLYLVAEFRDVHSGGQLTMMTCISHAKRICSTDRRCTLPRLLLHFVGTSASVVS